MAGAANVGECEDGEGGRRDGPATRGGEKRG
jgi:hypothetical protein